MSSVIPAPPSAIYRRLLGYCRPYWAVFVAATIGMGVFAATDTGYAWLIQNLIESLEAETLADQTAVQRWLPAVILGLFLIRGCAGFLSTYSLGWIGRQVIKQLRAQVFDKYMFLPVAFFDQSSTGDLLSRLTFNIEQIADSTSNVLTVLIRDTLTITGLVAFMIYLSPPLAAFIFLVAPALAVLIGFLGRIFRRHSARIQESMGDVTRIAEEALQGQKVIKIFNGQGYEGKRFEQANEKNRRLQMRLVATKAAGSSVTILVAALGIAGVAYVATSENIRTSMELGDFGGFITAMLLLMSPLKRLTNINAAIQRGIAAGDSIFQLLDHPVEADEGDFVVDKVQGEVEFQSVTFTYTEDKGHVLRDISLHAHAGETIAIVGRSGSGKSTLVSLLPRFYEPDAGSILIDNRPIGEYQLVSLRNQISLVSQEVTLFNDTIAGNIAYGSTQEVTRERIEQVSQVAHVSEFAGEMPAGLDTMVGDRGVLLSGGQRQRIAIARALLADAPILILDEATSALDTESERHIQQALTELMKDRTTFVIAHRLSTVEKADRIVVMAAGRIVEMGSHAQLLEQGGHYASLHRLQFKEQDHRS